MSLLCCCNMIRDLKKEQSAQFIIRAAAACPPLLTVLFLIKIRFEMLPLTAGNPE